MAGKIALSGLQSNLDTDSIITALVSAYSTKKDKYVKAQTKLEWKQEAWKDLNKKIYSFYSSKLSSMRFSSAFSVKKATSSSSKATVTAGSNAVSGTQKLKIDKLATSGYLTGGVVSKADSSDTEKITGSTKLSELGIADGSKISVTVNGEDKNISMDGSNTVNEFVVKLKEAGLDASFDENNQRFFISAKKSGKEADFSITANNSAGNDLLNNLKINSVTSADIEKYRKQAAYTAEDINNLIDAAYTKQKTANLDINDSAAMQKIKDNLSKAKEAATNANETLATANKNTQYQIDAWNEIKGMSSLSERSAKLDEVTSRLEELSAKSADSLTEDEKTELTKLQATKDIYTEAASDTFNMTTIDDKITELQSQIDSNTATIASNQQTIDTASAALADEDGFATYIADENDKINAQNTALKDSLTQLYNTQHENAVNYVARYDEAAAIVNADTSGMSEEEIAAYKASDEYKNAVAFMGGSADGNGAVRITGENAQIQLNGATFTSSSNNFQINGLTISANAVTGEDEEISITTDTDVDGIYNMVKDFFKEYNALIKEMDSLYNAESAKGYEPLTDDEKEALTDSEVDKWEKKVKDALLRRDDTLQSVSDAIKGAFNKSYQLNGKTYSLSTFGIATGGYFASGENEKSIYHIDGDKDDSTSSGNTDKLRAAIAADPDAVCSFFNQLAQGVYDTLSKKMAATSMSSAYTVYNDKKMQSDYKDYKKTISNWEKKIEDYEDKYRKQFTAMEKALASLNSNQTALSGMLG